MFGVYSMPFSRCSKLEPQLSSGSLQPVDIGLVDTQCHPMQHMLLEQAGKMTTIAARVPRGLCGWSDTGASTLERPDHHILQHGSHIRKAHLAKQLEIMMQTQSSQIGPAIYRNMCSLKRDVH